MRPTLSRAFVAFLIFGILNNILYVVILSAAVDIVGHSVPKSVVLLADIAPSLTIKITAPFFIHKLTYARRIWLLNIFSFIGMLLVSLSSADYMFVKVIGITMASLSSGLGEVSFLQLTHFYNEIESIGGFSMGTGGAGILGSFCFMMMTNVMGMKSWLALAIFSLLPFGFPLVFYFVLPASVTTGGYGILNDVHLSMGNIEPSVHDEDSSFEMSRKIKTIWARCHYNVREKSQHIAPLVVPYMIPLCSVYIAEYVINQGISPTILFELDDLPRWLFATYRDIYVVYGFVYQLGVFLSRSSVTFGVRLKNVYIMSVLQLINVAFALSQSMYDAPFKTIMPVLFLIFYEGLLGGLSYVNTFMNVSQEVDREVREFSLACVGISDSFGIMVAGAINVWLEKALCGRQVSRGKDWCKFGS